MLRTEPLHGTLFGSEYLNMAFCEPASPSPNESQLGLGDEEILHAGHVDAITDENTTGVNDKIVIKIELDPRLTLSHKIQPRSSSNILHYWSHTKKKLSNSTQTCTICSLPIGSLSSRGLMKCVQCDKKVHAECLERQEAEKHIKCKPILHKFWYTDDPTCTPLVVFVNAKSGGGQGLLLFNKLKELLGEDQVFDLAKGGPSEGLLAFKDVPNFRVLVAGGDGTVGWVLMQLDLLQITPLPPVAILPLGTGNDLARSLKWGPGYAGEKLLPIVKQLEHATVVPVDRWKVRILRFCGEEKSVVMNNYFSIGTDAGICLDFHNLRNDKPDLCRSRTINKMWYTYYGGLSTVKGGTPLCDQIIIAIDGQVIELPSDITGIIVLNLASYSAGADIWGPATKEDIASGYMVPSFQDGMLEVCAIKGAHHMGAITVGLAKSIKIGQGKSLVVHLKDKLPMQVDGEPWLEESSTIKISFLNHASMMYNMS